MTRPRSFLPAGVVAVLAVLASVLATGAMVPALAADPAETVTTLEVSPQSPVYGEDTVTLTAEVTSTDGPVTAGVVDFEASLSPMRQEYLGGVELDGDEVAVLEVEVDDVPGLRAGQTFHVSATYRPDDYEAYVGSSSEPVAVQTRTAGPSATPTGTTVTGPMSATVGVPVDLTAEVNPVEAAGTVQFRVAGQPVGDPVPVEAGEASLPSYTFDTTGWVRLSAFFTPSDPSAYGASDHALEVDVAPAAAEPVATTTTVTGPATATSGVATTLTAEVNPAEAAGTVQFFVDEEPVGDPVPVEAGTATLPSYTFRGTGVTGVIAVFTPADEEAFAASENWLEVDVAAAPEELVATTTTVTGPDSATVGVPTDLTAEVSPVEAEGWVQFLVDGDPVGDPVEVQDGKALASYTFDAAGTVEVAASFAPAYVQTYLGSDDTIEVDVAPAPVEPVATTTTVTGPDSATVGVAADLTAEVSPVEASGTVQFLVDGDPVGDPVEVAEGAASLPSHTFDAAGVVELTAAFSPTDDEAFTDSDDTIEVDVAPAPVELVETTTTVTGPDSATYGVPTDLTAEVSPIEAAGTVQFFVFGSPTGAPVAVQNGRAALSYTFTGSLVLDLALVSAVFTPEDAETYAGSDSSVLMFSVRRPSATPTTTSLTAPETVTMGQPVGLTASVSPAVDGTVQLLVDGREVGSPVPVSSGTAALTHTFTSVGSARLSAAFTPSAAGYAGSQSFPRLIRIAKVATAVVVTGPVSAEAGSAATLTARVTPADAPGIVVFFVNGLGLEWTPVSAGAASLPHIFETSGVVPVGAVFVPTDTGAYDVAEAAEVDVPVSRVATTIEVTGPTGATAGKPVSLRASVRPADVAGTVTFTVGDESRTAVVAAGVATVSHTFAAAGATRVVASFEPTDGSAHLGAVSAAHPVDVAAGPASTAGEAPISATPVSLTVEDDACSARAASRTSHEPVGIVVGAIELRVVTSSADGFEFNAFNIDTSARRYDARFSAVPCFGEMARAAEGAVTIKASCFAIESGIQCPVSGLPRWSRLTATVAVPMPADLAGRRVTVHPALTSTDPVTGEVTTLASDSVTAEVPRRTVLTAQLAPAKQHLTSIEQGRVVGYRIVVRNGGVLPATGVRTCVRVGRGAEVRTAPSATVRGQRACWTLPTLQQGATAVRTLVVVAPRKGDLTLRAVVTPKRSQADVVRLRTALPVR